MVETLGENHKNLTYSESETQTKKKKKEKKTPFFEALNRDILR